MLTKYDKIGIDYDLSRKADPYLLSRMYELFQPTSEGIYLDLGCGTGNYTTELAKKGIRFIGIDPSLEMLEQAREKINAVDWRQGNAEDIDLESESMDGVLISLTIHHWSDWDKGFSEVNRILKKGGRVVIFSPTLEQTRNYWLAKYFPDMIENSAIQLPTFQQLEDLLSNNGFKLLKKEPYAVKPDLKDLFLYSGKYNPELYFNRKVRNGISSFAALADPREVESGLTKLRNDIKTGKMQEIIANAEQPEGDYLFLLAEKH